MDVDQVVDVLRAVLQEMKAMKEDINQLKSTVDKKLDALEGTVAELKEEFENWKPLFVKAGDAFDILARRELRKLHGASFARGFAARDS